MSRRSIIAEIWHKYGRMESPVDFGHSTFAAGKPWPVDYTGHMGHWPHGARATVPQKPVTKHKLCYILTLCTSGQWFSKPYTL